MQSAKVVEILDHFITNLAIATKNGNPFGSELTSYEKEKNQLLEPDAEDDDGQWNKNLDSK